MAPYRLTIQAAIPTLVLATVLAASAQGDPRENLREVATRLDIERQVLTPAEATALHRRALELLVMIPLVTSVRQIGECRLSGSRDYTTDIRISCKEIVLTADAVIKVPGGRVLYLDGERIRIEPGARIEGQGGKGPKGASGAQPAGEWISGSDKAYWDALGDCRGRLDHPDRGHDGAKGGRGEPGALIVFGAAPTPDLPTINVAGGVGGDGGNGSSGRLYKNVRNYYCDGCTMNCPQGANGPPGDNGPAGAVLFLR
jgi:hypothetical protein